MYYKSQHQEVASVDIKASSENVYRTVVNSINKNPNIVILTKDDDAMLLDLRQNETLGSIKVTTLNALSSQLTITSELTAENEVTVLKTCKDLNVECEESK